jgi:uncharacterized membrane protein YkvA (DUF1232 family)
MVDDKSNLKAQGFKHLLAIVPDWVLIAVTILMILGVISPFDLIPGDALTAPAGGVGLIDDALYTLVAVASIIMEALKIRQKKQLKRAEPDDDDDGLIIENRLPGAPPDNPDDE